MAEEQAESRMGDMLSRMRREVQLNLTPIGGRVFVHSVAADTLNRSAIELRCRHYAYFGLFDLSVTIGDQKHKRVHWPGTRFKPRPEDGEEVGWRLSDCSITLSIYEADDEWVRKTAEANDGKPIFGRLTYREPIKTDDGVVNEKRPPVDAWVGMGPENYRLLRDRLLANDIDDLALGITVQFPEIAVESGWMGKTVKWDGKDNLPILEAVAVWRRKEWESHDDDREDEDTPTKDELDDYKPREASFEQTELMAGMGKIQTGIEHLMLPLWLAVIALVVIAARLLR